ncbi:MULTISPECIES: TraB/GumN family protein [Pacificimonas]|nr:MULTISPECIES: TraB/GumN family protein [Pacificimonas]MBZ6378918.1 TraB/GumN family protein [Pacificimonas aurantium]
MRRLFPVMLLAVLPGCAAPQPVRAAPQETDVAGDADPALFEVSDEDTRIYLFGTIHILTGSEGWFDEAVRDAFEASDELVIETLEPTREELSQTMMLGVDPAGKPLSRTISPDSYALLSDELVEAGVDPAAFEPLDPWLVAINLAGIQYQKLGMTPDAGAERRLIAAAEERGMPVSGLETLDYQFRLFDDLPEEHQVEFLEQSIEQLDDAESFIGRMTEAWASGDTAALSDVLNEELEDDPVLYARLITDRNRNWAAWIEERLDEPGTVFVAVGAGHLGGEGSVQSELEKRGISVTRIDY